MKKESNQTSISIGKTTNSFDELQILCQKEAEKLAKSIEITNQEKISIPFWTSDFPELICVGNFIQDGSGSIVYELDFSQSTL